MTEELKNEAQAAEAAAQTAEAAAEAAEAAEFAPKRKMKRWQIVVIVIVAVILVGGIGFGVWHNQPSFCNAICHTPMDNYVNGMASDNTQLAYQHAHVDGNAASTLKAGVSDSSKACLDCHEATLNEQIAEANSWMFGNYTVDTDGNVISESAPTGDKEFCTRCHDFEKVIVATDHYWGDDDTGNPHANHQGIQDCTSCHSPHGTSVLTCTSCHDYATPEGWQTVGEAQAEQTNA